MARPGLVLLLMCALTGSGCGEAAAPAPVEQLLDDLGAPGAYRNAWRAGTVRVERSAGFSWLALTTAGVGEPALLTHETPFSPALDLRERVVKFWLRVDRVERLAGVELRLGSGPFEQGFFAYAVPLYDDAAFNLLQPRTWIPITFTLAGARVEGAPDAAAIDRVALYVGDRSGAAVRVDWGGVALLDRAPEGVASLTFDDGYREHRQVAAPVMARHGFRGTAYVIPDLLGTPGHLTLEEAQELERGFGWEIGAHHQTPFTELPAPELEATVVGVRRFLAEHGLGEGRAHLAFPLGRHDPRVVMPTARKYFRTSRIAGGGHETLPPADPHKLRVFNVLHTTTPAEIGARARRAAAHGEWLILMFHYLVPEAAHALEYGVGDFERAMAALAASGISVQPVGEVWASLDRTAWQRGPGFAARRRAVPAGQRVQASASRPR